MRVSRPEAITPTAGKGHQWPWLKSAGRPGARPLPAEGSESPECGGGPEEEPRRSVSEHAGKSQQSKRKRMKKRRGVWDGREKNWSRWESLEVSRLQLHEQHVPEWAHATKGTRHVGPLYLVNVTNPSCRTTCTLCLLDGANRRQVPISCAHASESTCKPRWGPMTSIIPAPRPGPPRRDERTKATD